MIPNSIQEKVIEYVHLSLGHSGIEKCISQVNQECHIANLGHKVRKWAELAPHMEFWMNNTLAGPTGYTPSEIRFGSKKPSLFNNILPSITEDESTSDELRVKVAKAYERMKKRIEGRKKRRKEIHIGSQN
jgi:hypothetical protein